MTSSDKKSKYEALFLALKLVRVTEYYNRPSSREGYKIQAIERDYERLAGLSDVLGPKIEEQHELLDALSPIYDQLSMSRSWWILEILPFKQAQAPEG
ncbi:hypothetical protein BJ912DRAFT_1142659 [Pholiota molesta]|nr:hypothetical protein BJ912DRAFT_1142659 [Pholiota molesta]